MANRILRIHGLISNAVKINNIKSNASALGLLNTNIPLIQNVREITNFFNKKPVSLLWKAVTSVSNAGRRRGRGKGLPRIKNLNRGQKIGVGKIGIVFPGLNSPLSRGNSYVTREPLPDDPEREKALITLQNHSNFKRYKVHALKRGWTSASIAGRKIGPPDPIDNESFEGFESWIMTSKTVNIMTSHFGRTKRYRISVVTGNGNGLVGFSSVTGADAKATIKRAKNRAGQRLTYLERYNNHTVLYDFYTQFHRTKIFVKQMPEGYGIKAHRIIRVICEAVGIKNIHANIEGSLNPQYIIKAFFIGLLKQKTYQQLADEKQLHLVEFKKESDYFPKVIASPENPRSEIRSHEVIKFNSYIMGGKMVLKKKRPPPFYTKLPSYENHLRKMERRRDHDNVRIRLKAEYGDICSFLTEKYPEARVLRWKKKREQPTEDQD
ncbi:mitochondrial ribosomal protein S5 [Megalopta genalis]|uniref:mitochondrial ribosomal protein S5 n=1 Tax=Megalopta genalis TaxID=115081 RepID=UPI003FD59EAF